MEERWIDREGTFRGECIDAQIVEGSNGSQSVGLELTYLIKEALLAGDWDATWDQYGFQVKGTLWVIGKTGAMNERAAATARDVIGWDGSFDAIDPAKLQPCQMVVAEEVYNNKSRFKVQWFNAWDSEPRAKQLSATELQRLNSQHASKMRAFFGAKPTAAASAAPPAGRPTPPAAPVAPPAAVPAGVPAGATTVPNSEVPF